MVLREVRILGCGDCPFRIDMMMYGEVASTCDVVEDPEGQHHIAPEQDMKKAPAWCPLRDGPVHVVAEPAALIP